MSTKSFFCKVLLIFSSLVALIYLDGCGYALDAIHPTTLSNDGGSSSQSSTVPANQIDYAVIRTEIFAPHCYECHSLAGGNAGGINLETYLNIKSNLSDIQIDMADDSMPKDRPPLSSAEKNLLALWISQGAPEFVIP